MLIYLFIWFYNFKPINYEKLFFTTILALGITTFANAQCGEDLIYIAASCVSGCYSVYTMTGNLESDITPRKPTPAQANAIRNDLNDRCSTFAGRATITQPRTI